MDKGTQEKVATPLFSKEERRNVVRSFIEAYMRGGAKINFPEVGEVNIVGKKTLPEQASQMLDWFTKLLDTATGTKAGTETQVEDAIETLFRLILSSRLGGRIDGEFLQVTNIESRLGSMEESVAGMQAQMEELMVGLRAFLRVERGDGHP